MREGIAELGRSRIGLGNARRKVDKQKKSRTQDTAAPGNRPGFMPAMIRRSSLENFSTLLLFSTGYKAVDLFLVVRR